MGSIYKSLNKNGTITYYGSIYLNGKRIRKRLANSKPAALKALKKFEYDIFFNNSTKKSSRKLYLHALLDFLKQTELSGISYKCTQIISYTNKRFMNYCLDNNVTYIQDVTTELARTFFNIRTSCTSKAHLYGSKQHDKRPKLAPSTLNRELQYLKRYFNYCIDMEWIASNPFRCIKKMKETRLVQRYFFTTEQIELILKNSNQFYDFYMLLIHTGLRATDAYNLTSKNIHDNYIVLQMNKTKDLLHVPIPQVISTIMNRRLKHVNNEQNMLFTELLSERQRRACVKTIQSLFSINFVRANNINLHTFRHTYAHTMLNRGVPKEVLQTLLGHRSIKTTEIYANWVRKEELEKWV